VHDIDSLQDLLVRVIPPFAIALLGGAATVALMWWILPAAGLILLVALVLATTLLPWLTGRLARRSESRQATARGELTAAVVDLVEGAPELAANGALPAQLSRARALDAELTRVASAAAGTTGVGQGFAVLLTGLAMWGSLLVGVVAVHAGRLDGVLLAVIALVPLAAFELATGLPVATQLLRRVRGSAARTLEVMDAPAAVVEPSTPLPLPRAPYALRVRGLQARHGATGPWALDGVDLDLAVGRRVAVVGPSGAGKSTLAHVLLRFLPYDGGSVTLEGVEIDRLSGDDHRRVVGLVTQDAHVFDTTLEENVRLARRDATPEQLRSALRRARLWEWIEDLPEGLATEVGEHGSRLSGGQRQRLAIARALLADFPMLILDEPAEHLDLATGDALVADLLAATTGRATLLITHRLVGLQAVDEVIVLNAGHVVERGTHAELLLRGGSYAHMWEREIHATSRAPAAGDRPEPLAAGAGLPIQRAHEQARGLRISVG
jgi:thiol reductant ABC exporter CydC subunit